MAQEAQEIAAGELREQDHGRRIRELATRRRMLDVQIAALNAEAEERAGEINSQIAREKLEAEGMAARARRIAAARAPSMPAAAAAGKREK